MNILFITNYFYPEPFRNNELTTELIKRGHKVTVLTSYPSYPYGKIYDGYGFNISYDNNYKGVNIIRLKSAPRGKTPIGLINNCISFVKFGKKWIDECNEKFDVVYFPAISPSTSGLVAKYYKSKFPNTKMIIHIQDLWPESVEEVLNVRIKLLSKFLQKVMDEIYEASDYILCSSNSYVEYLKKYNKSLSNKLKFWPQFYIEPNEDKYNIPNEYKNLDNDTIKITFTGNIGYAQGLDLLIDTANYIKLNCSNLNIKWFLVGDGRAKQELVNKTNKLGLNDIITFIGRKPLEEANNYTHFADLSYLSFNNEFFNMTIPAKFQGYLACKSPILCVTGGESARIVSDYRCGVVAEKNVISICNKIIEYKNLSDIEKNELKNNAYKCFKDNFTMNKLINELELYMKK